MRYNEVASLLLALAGLPSLAYAQEGSPAEPVVDDRPLDLSARQAPWGRWNIDMTDHDRVYSIGSSPRAISVTDPKNDVFLGTIRLDQESTNAGSAAPSALASNAFGYAPNGRTLAVASGVSRSVTFLDTRSNSVVHAAAFEGSPAGASYTPNGKEVWIPVVGGRYLSVLAAKGFAEIARVPTPSEPGPTVLSNNGHYAYVCSGSDLSATVIDVAKRTVVGSVPGSGSPCTSIAVSPDGTQVWLTSKDGGRVFAFSAKMPFKALRSIDTGPGTSHVNFVSNQDGQFAYVTVERLNAVEVFDTDGFNKVATIRVGSSPTSLWPSGDGSRMYVGLDGEGALGVIDTATMRYVDVIKVGDGARTVAYVPSAVRSVRENPNLEKPPESAP
jgi:DNA-binding beta-propeller fold protein YncE